MRTGAAAGHDGYYHEAVCYRSDAELLAVAVPFLLDGVAAGEPTVVSLGEQNEALVRAALPADAPVTFLTGGDVYARPAAAIKAYRQLLAGYVAEGARQIRIIGEVPRVALGATWDWWARYESAINRVYDDYPLWSMCAYDTRITPAPVLGDIMRTHPRIATADGRSVPSGTYTDPAAYLTETRTVLPDPLQRTAPVIELTDPTPTQARRAVYGADRGQLPADDVEDLVVAVSETVTNALRYGRPPVRFRLWTGDDRIVVTVSDGGTGPKDPFAGLIPAGNGSPGGLGLWITYQSCGHVALHRDADTFTVRLTAGNPHFAV
ncbi:sensor histidine kinase [Plantactinospora soyae]|uniref:Anti-sigma regulatory factor (Ser/Thr protein kinase) n=1 Tax=Plantactinospora soyae TaxID=1544732 RepID=A0A927MAM6_9ACTN|nr:sensor histidine kinase [Plantactinospora soyae]MBE1487570.1 anti-sigma regulatory factor (Ser/Thr protein kinase) [Plantactinospora soyae]